MKFYGPLVSAYMLVGLLQHVELLAPMEKHRRVEQILRSQEPGSKIIIFCSTKKMCDQLARNLSRQFGAAVIHGDKSQGERDHVLSQFRTGRSPILVATDVAARGLDIKDIRLVYFRMSFSTNCLWMSFLRIKFWGWSIDLHSKDKFYPAFLVQVVFECTG